MTFRTPSGQEVPVRFEVNPRAKRLILRLDQKNREGVAVAPSKRQLKAAAAFAEERVSWIAERLNAAPEHMELSEGTIIPLRGIETHITAEGTGSRLPRLITGKEQILSLPGAAETLPARATRYLKREAKSDLKVAVDRYTAELGVTYKRISVKDTRSRWGSCSADGNLSFSWRLILAEPFVLDYVAAHEVAHRIEMNHSPAFWAQVERIYPNWKQASAWLKRHGGGLHAIGA